MEALMSTSYRYALPVEQSEWKFDGHTDVTFTWEYDENRDGLLQLYAKGKKQHASIGPWTSIPKTRCSSTTASCRSTARISGSA